MDMFISLHVSLSLSDEGSDGDASADRHKGIDEGGWPSHCREISFSLYAYAHLSLSLHVSLSPPLFLCLPLSLSDEGKDGDSSADRHRGIDED